MTIQTDAEADKQLRTEVGKHRKEDRPIPADALDPFIAAPLFEWTRNKSSWTLLAILVPLFAVPAVIAAWAEGSLGPADGRGFQDVASVLGLDPTPDATADFPLSRDVTSWFMGAVIIATALLVHRQWQLMSEALPYLTKVRAIKPLEPQNAGAVHPAGTAEEDLTPHCEATAPPERQDTKMGFWARKLGVDEVIGSTTDSEKSPLEELVKRTEQKFLWRFSRTHLRVVALVLAAIAAALIPILAFNINGAFHALIPDGTQDNWPERAYASWWAGVDHLPGMFIYLVLAALGIYIVFLQNIVGLACAYLVAVLPRVTNLDADWLNRDGRYGWSVVGRIMRTVYSSLALHGLALSVIFITFGLENSVFLILLFLIWVFVVPTYTFVPLWAFRRVKNTARKQRICEIERMMYSKDINEKSSPADLEPFLGEIERARTAKIRPLRIRGFEIPLLPFLIGAIISPIVVGVMQPFVNGWLGAP